MATLRHWESVGLLEAPPRWGGKRVFPETVLIRIAVIDLARRAGFRLQEIRQLLAPEQGLDAPGPRWRALAVGKLLELDRMLAAVEEIRRLLGYLMNCQCGSLDECAAKTLACPSLPAKG